VKLGLAGGGGSEGGTTATAGAAAALRGVADPMWRSLDRSCASPGERAASHPGEGRPTPATAPLRALPAAQAPPLTTSSRSSSWRIGRALVLLAALVYGVLPGIIDFFTPQHLGDPDWAGHRRFHLIWQICLVLVLGLRGLWFAWRADSPARLDLIHRSAGQGAVVLTAFFSAGLLAVPLHAAYGAPDEVFLGVPWPIAHFSTAALILASGVLLCRRASRAVRPQP